jgi:hypothetical protein
MMKTKYVLSQYGLPVFWFFALTGLMGYRIGYFTAFFLTTIICLIALCSVGIIQIFYDLINKIKNRGERLKKIDRYLYLLSFPGLIACFVLLYLLIKTY